MATGLVALLDDVAAISKLAAASLDDVTAAAGRAGAKTAGVVIDDAAVTPRYVTGFDPARELPMIARIARGSIKNKLLILLPAAVLLGQFAPFLIPVILILGGLFLSYEAAEKILELFHVDDTTKKKTPAIVAGGEREKEMVSGAIRTDLILSAEIMAISLAEVMDEVWWQQALILALIGIVITVVVYGAVAIIVKMDDVGLHLAETRKGALARFGRGLVGFMPKLLTGISVIGTVAMAWVGGGLLVHNAYELGWKTPEYWIEAAGGPLVEAAPGGLHGFLEWLVFAVGSAIVAVIVGAVIATVLHKMLPQKEAAAAH